MRWPWQAPIVEHRSSLTDQVVVALLQVRVRWRCASCTRNGCARIMRDAVRECAVGVFGVGAGERDTGARCELAVDGGVESDSHGAMRCTSSGPIPRPVSRSSLRRAGMSTAGRGSRAGSIASSWPAHRRRPGARCLRASCCISAGRSTPRGHGRVSRPMQRASDTGSLSGLARTAAVRRSKRAGRIVSAGR